MPAPAKTTATHSPHVLFPGFDKRSQRDVPRKSEKKRTPTVRENTAGHEPKSPFPPKDTPHAEHRIARRIERNSLRKTGKLTSQTPRPENSVRCRRPHRHHCRALGTQYRRSQPARISRRSTCIYTTIHSNSGLLHSVRPTDTDRTTQLGIESSGCEAWESSTALQVKISASDVCLDVWHGVVGLVIG